MPTAKGVELRMHSGVPIVDIAGEWTAATVDALKRMVAALTASGHFDIVLNATRCAPDIGAAAETLDVLTRSVRSHCGRLEVVATREQMAELRRLPLGAAIRAAASEEWALGRIKGTPVFSTGIRCTAHPAEHGLV